MSATAWWSGGVLSGGLTDVLGELTLLDEDRLVVRTEAGTDQEIPLADVVAAKRIPTGPARYSEILALERIANRAWPAPEIELLGGWLLRAADGWTNRANSALPLGDAGISLAETADACRDWYTERGLTPKITVPLPVRRDVARHLDAAGWTAQPLVLVQTAPLAGMIDAGPSPQVELRERPSAEFLAVIRARKAALPPSAEHVLTAVPAVRFAEVRTEDGSSARHHSRRRDRGLAAHRPGRGRTRGSAPRTGSGRVGGARRLGPRPRRDPGVPAGRGGQRSRGTAVRTPRLPHPSHVPDLPRLSGATA